MDRKAFGIVCIIFGIILILGSFFLNPVIIPLPFIQWLFLFTVGIILVIFGLLMVLRKNTQS